MTTLHDLCTEETNICGDCRGKLLRSQDKLFSIRMNSAPDLHDRTTREIRGSQTRVAATAWLETFATLHETGKNQNCDKIVATTREEGQKKNTCEASTLTDVFKTNERTKLAKFVNVLRFSTRITEMLKVFCESSIFTHAKKKRLESQGCLFIVVLGVTTISVHERADFPPTSRRECESDIGLCAVAS